MIYELRVSDFDRINHLLEKDTINLEIKAVANKFNPGWIFVDNVNKPKTAMVWSKGIEGFYFLGEEANNEFNNFINIYVEEEIIPRAKELGLNNFEFSGTSNKWDIVLEKIFKSRDFYKSKQFVYKRNNEEKKINEQSNLPKGVEVRKVDKLFLKSEVGNKAFVKSIILEWWNNIEDFLENGVGFCVINENKIVTSCISSFVTERSMESHIVTIDEYRRRGFAKIAVDAFLKHCTEHNYESYWDCMETNFGSRGLAESLGYYKDYEYILYGFSV